MSSSKERLGTRQQGLAETVGTKLGSEMWAGLRRLEAGAERRDGVETGRGEIAAISPRSTDAIPGVLDSGGGRHVRAHDGEVWGTTVLSDDAR